MLLLPDENLPRALRLLLSPHHVVTVQEQGWAGVKNGELVALADNTSDVLLTANKNLRYQQNLTQRRLAIVELPTNRRPTLGAMRAAIDVALQTVANNHVRHVVVPWNVT